jgi:polyhydroxyalkanoate synthesis regulator phasin
MAESRARISLNDVRASMKRMQAEGERLVARVRRDARTLATRSRRETVSTLLNDARKLQGDLRKRAERAIQDLETRRTRILTSLEEQATALVERVVRGLNVATRDEVTELKRRIAELERRLDKERAA